MSDGWQRVAKGWPSQEPERRSGWKRGEVKRRGAWQVKGPTLEGGLSEQVNCAEQGEQVDLFPVRRREDIQTAPFSRVHKAALLLLFVDSPSPFALSPTSIRSTTSLLSFF